MGQYVTEFKKENVPAYHIPNEMTKVLLCCLILASHKRQKVHLSFTCTVSDRRGSYQRPSCFVLCF